ncbi:hypothetical protein N9Z65_01130 [bacterium]|nr:hypothetical protein [bacterium]
MQFNTAFNEYINMYSEAKEAPKGKHYTKRGVLKSGDADADGNGGPKFRSDPTYVNPNEDNERDIDEDTISELAAIDHELGEGATVADVIRDYGSEIVKKYIDYKTHPARYEDAEHEDGDSIRVDTERHNHRGGVISRGVSTFKTMEDLNKVLPRMKELYHRILVNGKELGEEEVKSAIAPPESEEGISGEDLDDFHTALDEIIHKYLGHSSEESDQVEDGEEEVQSYFQGEYSDEMDRYDENTVGAISNMPDEDAEYRGRKVTLNKPTRGDVKKFKVYVKDPKTGNVKKVNFGHGGTSAKRKTMRIRKSNPKARKSFRARHKCDQKKSKLTPGYWSCRKW